MIKGTDLERGEPKFQLAEELDSEVVLRIVRTLYKMRSDSLLVKGPL